MEEAGMKVVVFGATGGTGRELVKHALGHAHTVRAFVRRPDKLKIVHHRLEVVTGDVLDAASVQAAVAGQDAVFSALGVNGLKADTILSEGVANLLAAMEKERVRRLVFVSSLGVGDSRKQSGPLFRWVLLPTLLKHLFADKEKAEELIRASEVDWTIVRPGRLTKGRLTARYRIGQQVGGLFPRISRGDVADFMLHAVERDEFVRDTPGLAY
jgi:uncharacterized protein YbjT (DUF2867 family)